MGTHRKIAHGPGKLIVPNREEEKPMNKMGIPDWVIYPQVPGYGNFLNPPYKINGHIIRGAVVGWS